MPRQLTIQAFPTPLKIASLLRFPLQSGSLRLHPLGQNLLARLLTFAPLHSPEFFGLVSNDAEVAVYASADMVLKAVDDLCATQQEMEKWIEVTVDVWKVFQVDGEGMGGQKGESSSDQRSIIYTVTAVLAKAGISCKYQSSYYADFVLVKNEQFAETTELFQSCGWSVEDSDHTPTSQSSAQVSTRSRSPPTPRGYPSRQSTSSLPEASNEWITYYDSPAAAVTIPRRRARPHTADECVGSNEQARRGGGLRSLADCGVKRRSMSNVLDLQKDERLLAHGQELELMSVRDERPSLHKPHIGLESERVEDAILAQHDSEKQQRTVESLMVSEVVSSWSEALVEQLDSLLLDQESESGIDRAEERRPSTPSSVTIDMGADMHRSGSLMYSVFPSCPIRSSASDARFESTSSSAPVGASVSHLSGGAGTGDKESRSRKPNVARRSWQWVTRKECVTD
ncbi:hypothetical protein QFC24_004130 [Naganishia onofrii]|uniref:Uncharacterized protein n=1 Tax=Naganishia onofrii TaxID=1851511 RepID=A0ACC2XH28_9TREE|nr:hypothetical protein QFC24_004130 [Naganishia onofrii]